MIKRVPVATIALGLLALGAHASEVDPFLKKNCTACHNEKLKTADLNLATPPAVSADPETWEKVAERLKSGTMPPKGFPRPPQADIEQVTHWVEEQIARNEQQTAPDPGRVTARRLNRTEYNNTVRDLFGLDLHPADAFPQDDSGYGFDNIGDVLSVSPVLLEKYLKAAELVVRTALFGGEKRKPTVMRYQPPNHDFPLFAKAQLPYDETGLSAPSAVHATLRFSADGEYQIRAAIEGRRPNGSEPVHIGIWLDGKQVKTLDIDAPSDGGSIDLFGAQADIRMHVPAGDHWIAASLLKIYEGLPASYGGPNPTTRPLPAPPDISKFMKLLENATAEEIAAGRKKVEERIAKNKVPANRVWVHYIEAIGPYKQDDAAAVAESRKRVLPCEQQTAGCRQTIVDTFARRAFRRPVTAAEMKPYLELAAKTTAETASFDQGIATALEAVIVSPDFLFRIERGNAGKDVKPVSQYALASRLSYFLWSSMPDEALMQAAARGSLRQPAVLKAQVTRMLADPKSKALVENFAGQWLELRRLESVAPDREKFPEFDDYLRMSMREETERFFQNLMHKDGSILELLDAKYTFVNEKLASFYQIPGVKGPEFRRVDLTGTPRSGVLTQASVLTVSSYATRTSPVLRGKWVLENFLNAPIPPPPPNVPALDESKIGASGSMRTQMVEHQKNPACASCHSKMDPIGFAFENFNAVGQWRTKDGNFPIDTSGTLPDGRQFQGPAELTTLLRKDKQAFAECVTDKMLTYALGRGLQRYDKRTVRAIATAIGQQDYKFSSLVLEVVNSLPFQMERGDKNKT